MSPTDKELLRQYCEGSESAFGELVRRHLNMVFSSARRQTRSPTLAEEITDGRGVDLVIDIGGAATLNDSFRAARMGGSVAIVGLTGGAKVEIDVTQVFSQLLRIRGIGVGSRADLQAVLRAMETRQIRPAIDREFAFEEVGSAFRHFKAGAHFGKVVIRAA